MSSRGRPPLPAHKRRPHRFSIQVTQKMKQDLLASAGVNGHSLSQEVQRRLERSFRDDELDDLRARIETLEALVDEIRFSPKVAVF